MTHAIAITTANISDRAGALLASKQHKPTLSNVKSVLIDDGYTGDPFAESVKELFNATVQVAKRLAMPPYQSLCFIFYKLSLRLKCRIQGYRI